VATAEGDAVPRRDARKRDRQDDLRAFEVMLYQVSAGASHPWLAPLWDGVLRSEDGARRVLPAEVEASVARQLGLPAKRPRGGYRQCTARVGDAARTVRGYVPGVDPRRFFKEARTQLGHSPEGSQHLVEAARTSGMGWSGRELPDPRARWRGVVKGFGTVCLREQQRCSDWAAWDPGLDAAKAAEAAEEACAVALVALRGDRWERSRPPATAA
jgi:hypothetical protein